MSFDNVVGGKLNLKGGALPVVGGIKKKKKKAKTNELVRPLSARVASAAEATPCVSAALHQPPAADEAKERAESRPAKFPSLRCQRGRKK